MNVFISTVNQMCYGKQESYSTTETFFALLGLIVINAVAWLPMLLLVYTW